MSLTPNFCTMGNCHVQIWVLVFKIGTKSQNLLQTRGRLQLVKTLYY